MAVFELGPSFSQLVSASPQEFKILEESTSFRVDGYFWAPAYKAGHWDGYKRLLNKKGYFPTGLWKFIDQKLQEAGFEPKIQSDRRKIYDITGWERRLDASKLELWDYQVDAVASGIDNPCGIISSPMGSGKTVIAGTLIKMFDRKTLVLTNRQAMLYQLSDFLRTRFGEDVGLIGDGHKEINHKITVAIVQALTEMKPVSSFYKSQSFNLKEWLLSIEYFQADECHHSPADTWYHLIMGMHNACARHGFTATPFRSDNLDMLLWAATGPVIYYKKTSDLIPQYLARPRIYVVEISDPLFKADHYATVENLGIATNRVRNDVICQFVKEMYSRGKSVIVMVDLIEHGKILRDMFRTFILPEDYEFMTGSEPSGIRKECLHRLRIGKLKIVICTSIWQEGVDVPGLDAGVNAAGGDSDIATIQKLGRIVRKKEKNSPTEEPVYYLDFKDLTHKFLKKHSLARERYYRSEEKFLVQTGKNLTDLFSREPVV